MKLLVSACLLGVACRYDGRSKLHPLAQELCRRHEVIPVCGEIFGGLPTPRLPSERREGGVFASDGGDVTDAFRRGRRRWCVWPEIGRASCRERV